jgi:beta-lactam-binding protein with PASTA domain
VAAPVFSEICTRILPYLNVAPDGSNVVIAPPVAAGIAVGMPNLAGMDVFAATRLVQSIGCTAGITGNGSTVESQVPDAGTPVYPGQVVQVRLTGKSSTMPDLTGMPSGKAISLLVALGLKPELNGAGKVVSQSPSAGSSITNGALARLDLR